MLCKNQLFIALSLWVFRLFHYVFWNQVKIVKLKYYDNSSTHKIAKSEFIFEKGDAQSKFYYVQGY